MFESRISAERVEKLPFPQNLRISSWSYDMAGHAKKCVERYCELANKTTQQLYKVSAPCIDDHHFIEEEEMTSVGELSHACSQIVLKCLYLARIGRHDILWSIVSVLGNVSRVSDGSGKSESDVHKRHKPHEKIGVMKDIDSVPSNVQSASQEALLYEFEVNEAVIKMIIKGRSPTMRHVSRTHRVALDWLFDRSNLDSKIQIKYIDTKKKLADNLTKGNFTRDEWNHLLNLFDINHFSSTACTAAMAKRAQQESGKERVTSKSRPMMNLTARMPSVVSSSTSSNPGEDLVWISRSWEICCK